MIRKVKDHPIFVWMLVLIGLFGACALLYGNKLHAKPAFSAHRFSEETFIIDPGHGGEDGGAISHSGTIESSLNLSIALRLESLLAFYGANTMLTRSEDISLHSENASTLREKKRSDLQNRVKMIRSIPNATLISIHQNSYPQKSYRGMQVFYSNEKESIRLAQQIDHKMKTFLDPKNKRKPLKIPETVYLMKQISCRAVLVECGFLSNPNDDRLLQNPPYQIKIAMTLAAAILDHPSP